MYSCNVGESSRGLAYIYETRALDLRSAQLNLLRTTTIATFEAQNLLSLRVPSTLHMLNQPATYGFLNTAMAACEVYPLVIVQGCV